MWSKELQDLTRTEAYTGAMVKSDNGEFGMIVSRGADGIKIADVERAIGSFVPTATDKIIAEFADVEKMIAAGWVID